MSEDEGDRVSLEPPLSPRSKKNAHIKALRHKREAAYSDDRKEYHVQKARFYIWQTDRLKELYASSEYQTAPDAEKPALVEEYKAACHKKSIAKGKHHCLTAYGQAKYAQLKLPLGFPPAIMPPVSAIAPPKPAITHPVPRPDPSRDILISTMPSAQHTYLSTLPVAERLYLIQPDDEAYWSYRGLAPGPSTSVGNGSRSTKELESGSQSMDTS